MSDDDRPRRSWREIDRNKDRSAHRRDERPEQKGKGPRREKSYRATLDRLFDSGKIAELVEQKTGEPRGEADNRIKALARIRDAASREDVTASVDDYLKKYDALPDDLELWARVLEHRDPSMQMDAMQRIDGLLELEQPKRTRAMLGQLRMIRDIGDEREMVELAKRLIDRLE